MPLGPDVPAAHVAATARLLAGPGLAHDEAVVGVATAVGGAGGPDLWERLDDAARPLFGLADCDLETQADAVWTAVTDGLRMYRCDAGAESGTVLLNRAMSGEPAHALLLAVAGHELARRAGLPSAVARARVGWWTALVGEDAFLPIGYGQPPAGSAAEFRGCCAHQVAFALLSPLCGPGDACAGAAGAAARRACVLRAALECGHDDTPDGRGR